MTGVSPQSRQTLARNSKNPIRTLAAPGVRTASSDGAASAAPCRATHRLQKFGNPNFFPISANVALPNLAISRRCGRLKFRKSKSLFGGNVEYQGFTRRKIWKSVFRGASHGLRLAVRIEDCAAEKPKCQEIDSDK
jgi:hypothetical protein